MLCIGLSCDGDTGDSDFLRHDRINAAREAELHWAAHLAAVQGAFHKGGHYRAKGANIVEVLAHKITDFLIERWVVFFRSFQIFVYAQIGQRFRVATLERHLILDVNAVAGGIFLGSFHIIADLTLEAAIRDQTVTGFRIDTGHIAGIRITVRVAVFHVKQDDKIIAVFDSFGHDYDSSFVDLA